MNIAFFFVGKDTTQAEMFCESARGAFKFDDINIVQISNYDTPKVENAHQILRLQGIAKNSMMLSRMRAYRKFLSLAKAPTVFFDTDILIVRRFKLDFSCGTILCQREYDLDEIIGRIAVKIQGKKILFPELLGKHLGNIFPYVGCFFADKDTSFLDKAIEIYEQLDAKYHLWFGDQIALRDAASGKDISTVGESQIACDPRLFRENSEDVAALHFKGANNKLSIRSCFESHLQIIQHRFHRCVPLML